MMLTSKQELQELLKITTVIVESYLDWEDKYDLIFSEKISGRVFRLMYLDYYDPDTSYQEDVMAFFEAFKEALLFFEE